jgi:hypothetical protein
VPVVYLLPPRIPGIGTSRSKATPGQTPKKKKHHPRARDQGAVPPTRATGCHPDRCGHRCGHPRHGNGALVRVAVRTAKIDPSGLLVTCSDFPGCVSFLLVVSLPLSLLCSAPAPTVVVLKCSAFGISHSTHE